MVESRRLETDARIAKLRGDIGRPLEDIASARARPRPGQPRARNIETMAARIEALARGGRARTSRCTRARSSPGCSSTQGALGVTTATLAEAVAMAESGAPDVLVSKPRWSPRSRSRDSPRRHGSRGSRVVVDDAEVLAATGRVAVGAGVQLGLLVDVDVGLDRGGARSIEETLRLAELAAETDGVSFDGLMGYEGHCASEPDRSLRAAEAARAMSRLARGRYGLPRRGPRGRGRIGGRDRDVRDHRRRGRRHRGAGRFVRADGPLPRAAGGRVRVRAGRDVDGDRTPWGSSGARRRAQGRRHEPPTLEPPDPRATLAFVHEEHAGFRYTGEAPGSVGDRVHIVPGYAPTTVNLFGAYHVVEDGRVADVWPVLARHGDQ